jgi:glycosyltransferase involved in cell wall biosynthesis
MKAVSMVSNVATQDAGTVTTDAKAATTVRAAIVVSSPVKAELADMIKAGEAPRRDYFELRNMLGAELLAPPANPSWPYRLLHLLGGHALAMACTAWWRHREYDVVLTDQEACGLVLGMLFKLTRVRMAHVMISHYLTPAKKQVFYRLFGVQSHIACTVCYSTAQHRLARERLGLAPHQVRLVLHPADDKFWVPACSDAERAEDAQLLRQAGLDLPEDAPVVCSAGLEFRDYPTLLRAARMLPASTLVVIAASSPWSKRKNTAQGADLPRNVRLVSLKPLQLRALYRRSRVVAIPLYDVDFQAGSLVAYEAMACGKPVVMTRTRGQNDILRDGETGLYVRVGDAYDMADALNRLLADPELARAMGRRGRAVVEQGLNLDAYLQQMVRLVREVAGHAVAQRT